MLLPLFFNSSSVYKWQRWSIYYPKIGIFPSNGTINLRLLKKKELGDCAFMVPLAAVAEYPSLIKNTIITQINNKSVSFKLIIY